MKVLLIWPIKLYWLLIPIQKRRQCLFKISCSQHVYHTTKQKGFVEGLKAFKYRYQNCRRGFQLIDLTDDERIMVLPMGEIIKENEISERLIIKKYNQ